MAFLHCRSCDHKALANHDGFQLSDLDKKLACKNVVCHSRSAYGLASVNPSGTAAMLTSSPAGKSEEQANKRASLTTPDSRKALQAVQEKNFEQTAKRQKIEKKVALGDTTDCMPSRYLFVPGPRLALRRAE